MEHLFVKNIIICAWDILLLFTINYTKRMQNKKIWPLVKQIVILVLKESKTNLRFIIIFMLMYMLPVFEY